MPRTPPGTPPLRSAPDREELWERVLAGDVDIIASDHSPSSPELKHDPDFFRIWGGIAGVQSTLPALLEAGHCARGLPLAGIIRMTAETPQRASISRERAGSRRVTTPISCWWI